MAARNAAEVSDKPVRRVVPGAAPPASAAAKPKKKKGGAAKKDETVQVTDAASAALITKAPEAPSNVAAGLKVTSSDLAEEAEKQTALATVEILEDVEKNGTVLTPSTPAQTVIVQQIEKLKSSAASSQGQIQELELLFDAVRKAEESDAPAKSAPVEQDSSSKAQLVLLLQFLHLFNLFHPNPANPPSFAPSQVMPPALQMSTGQQVAALGKLFDQLANGPLEGGGGDALEILANIESGSDKEVLPDVTFDTVRSMIFKLTAPPAEASEERLSPEVGLDGPMKGFITAAASPSAGQPPVSFIQESELIDHTEQEPEGGQPDTVPTTGSGPTAKGEAGGAGAVPGSEVSTTKADGSAAAQVAEPVNTTEVNPAKSQAKLNWADVAEGDDDDLGEAPVFEPLSSSATPTTATPASATPTSAWSTNKASAPAPAPVPTPTATEPATPSGPSINQPKDKKPKSSNGQAANGKGPARNGSAPVPETPKPVGKAQPKVDEDGFIVQESKRTRYLQQKQQQQQQNRGGGRGGARMGNMGNRGGARQGGQQRTPTRGAQSGDASGETPAPRS